MNNADQPAFPGSYKGATQGIEVIDFVPGITKREYFAAMAMQGMCAGAYNFSDHSLRICQHAIEMADSLLRQLETTKPKP